MFALAASFLALLQLASAIPVPGLDKRATTYKQVIAQDFADPGLLRYGTGWYAFATNNHKTLGDASAIGSGSLINVQIAHSPDFNTWTVLGQDALPNPGAWVNSASAAVWAPKVFLNDNGKFVLTYSAAATAYPGKHCVGMATASTPTGPFTPQATPFVCSASQGGAIDSSHYQNLDGKRYIVYKIDGNSLGHGGSCSNLVAPIVPTPIMIQRVAGDGITTIGSPIQLLDRTTADGPLIEAPSLVRSASGKYILYYSGGCFAESSYDVNYAVSDSVTGPFVRQGSLYTTGTLFAPGGADASMDGQHVVFHAGNVGPANTGYRSMYTTLVSLDNSSKLTASS